MAPGRVLFLLFLIIDFYSNPAAIQIEADGLSSWYDQVSRSLNEPWNYYRRRPGEASATKT